MFTGIVEGLGRVLRSGGGRLELAAGRSGDGLRPGDSLAVSGVCLTVAEQDSETIAADVMPETLQRTTLGALRPGDAANLERAMLAGDRISGHLVTGHVDARGVVSALRQDGNARWATIEAPSDVMALVAEKGCVAVDGISLTVVDVLDASFSVSLIPTTLATTTAGGWTVGSQVNLEVDLIARYVQRALHVRHVPQ